MTSLAPSSRSAALAFGFVWVASALYLAAFVSRGWVPHDEGMLGQSAERVLKGEVPHIDYDESYTGGLSYAHALAFRLLGVKLVSLRIAMFAAVVLLVPVVYALASRLVPPWPAALATLLAVTWSLPNYFASMPSWYVLLFSLLGTWALLRHVETGRRWPLFLAGLCGAAAILVIIVGLYFVAAALLFLAFREQELARERALFDGGGASFAIAAAMVAVLLSMLLLLLRSSLTPMSVLHFVLPPAAVCGALLAHAWSLRRRGTFGERFLAHAALAAPFLAGLAIPLLLFTAFYAHRGGLPDLARGLFALPMRQIRAASLALPPLTSFAAALPYAALLALPARERSGTPYRWLLPTAAAGLALLLALSSSDEVYRLVWHSARSLGVVAVVVGCASLVRRDASLGERRTEAFLFFALAALLSLVQFPYAAPIYFCYVAPVVVLALMALVAPESRRIHGIVALFYLAFAVGRMNPGYIWNLGVRPAVYGPLALLELPRGGLRIPASDARVYEDLVAAIAAHSSDGYVYAAPDCPEVHFLAARRSPTRYAFDYLGGPPPDPAALIRRLRATMVEVVVLNSRPDYSAPISPSLHSALEAEFPHSEGIGKFEVRWRR